MHLGFSFLNKCEFSKMIFFISQNFAISGMVQFSLQIKFSTLVKKYATSASSKPSEVLDWTKMNSTDKIWFWWISVFKSSSVIISRLFTIIAIPSNAFAVPVSSSWKFFSESITWLFKIH